MTSIKEHDFENALISIGGLSKACGVPVETLRNWERRYGFPEPSRLDSGHRRYPLEIAQRLRLIKQVIDLGYKPSYAVRAPGEEISSILAENERASPVENMEPTDQAIKEELGVWFESVKQMDATGLEAGLRRAWTGWGAYRFITKLLVPFFREVGDRWFDGRHTVAHEHFASEIAQSFLASMWRPLSSRANGARVVLANLEGELHSLGLHMAAVFLALNDLEVVFLGPNTPRADMIAAAKQTGVVALVIGLSAASDVERAAKELKKLREELKSAIIVAFGGNDSLPVLNGVQWVETFEEFEKWCRNLGKAETKSHRGYLS